FDPINANLIKNEILYLKQQGSTIVFSTHNMGSVEELCDNIALINRSKKILDGPVKEIRKANRSNIYEIEFTGNMMGFTNSLWTFGKLGEYVMEGEICKAQIQLTQGSTSNQLLSSVLSSVEIHSFKEIVPSMNDIFIKKVSDESIVGTKSSFTE
ncbi:MAG: DUF4162 domain-containing protein, partial [Bacteroidetes bacterium]|nr:DUF4162 domain-containing protein [Bacteroidota bacterium]